MWLVEEGFVSWGGQSSSQGTPALISLSHPGAGVPSSLEAQVWASLHNPQQGRSPGSCGAGGRGTPIPPLSFPAGRCLAPLLRLQLPPHVTPLLVLTWTHPSCIPCCAPFLSPLTPRAGGVGPQCLPNPASLPHFALPLCGPVLKAKECSGVWEGWGPLRGGRKGRRRLRPVSI